MPISILDALGMWVRKVPVGPMRRAVALAERAGLEVEVRDLEAHAIAGGDVARLAEALIEARRLGISADIQQLGAIDLSGRDVLEEVRAAARRGDPMVTFEEGGA